MVEAGKGKDSFWAPYIKLLPRTFDILPLWSPEELEELQEDSDVIKEVLDHQQKTKLFFHEKFLPLLNQYQLDGSKLTFETYVWAAAAAATRCFYINGSLDYAMVPMADLLNHHPESPTTWKIKDDFIVVVARGGGFERGTQIYNNYGFKRRYVS